MSSMAKIFVVVNLALGIVAFGSAATLLGATDDYKRFYEAEVSKHKQTKIDDQAKIDDLDLQKQQQAQKASEERGRAETLQSQVDELRASLAAANTANDTLRTSVENFSKELQTANGLNKANQEFLQRLADEARKATEDALNAKSTLDKEINNRVGLEAQVNALNDQVQTLSAEKGDVERQLREKEFWLEKYRVKYGDMVGPEGASGQVMQVRNELVSISVGSADKVKVGDWYAISRGPSYVGRIQIRTVDKNLSVGWFDGKNPGSGAPPQPGDKATPAAE